MKKFWRVYAFFISAVDRGGKRRRYPRIGGCVAPAVQKKEMFPLSRFEPRFPGRLARSLVTIGTELTRIFSGLSPIP
jgi:hypothetical protein